MWRAFSFGSSRLPTLTIERPPPMGTCSDDTFYQQLASIAIAATLAISAGTSQLTETVKDAAGKTVNESNFVGTRVWASSDPTKATVSQSGLVTKVAAGATNITCAITRPNYLGGATVTSNTCVVTVS
jgi:hypothetical protein